MGMGGHIKIYSILKKSFIYWFRFWNVQSIDSICCVISMYPSFYFLSFSKITIKGHKHWGKMNFFQSFLLNGKSTLFSSYWYALYYIIFVQKIKKKNILHLSVPLFSVCSLLNWRKHKFFESKFCVSFRST